jgi:hypothetical protein
VVVAANPVWLQCQQPACVCGGLGGRTATRAVVLSAVALFSDQSSLITPSHTLEHQW